VIISGEMVGVGIQKSLEQEEKGRKLNFLELSAETFT